MKDKDTDLIYEAYNSFSDLKKTKVGELKPGYNDLGSPVLQDQLADIIGDLEGVEPYNPGTIEFTDEFKQSLEQLLRHAVPTQGHQDPDYPDVDERTVAAELDNYIGYIHTDTDTEPFYRAIKRYLNSAYGSFTEKEHEEEDPRPDIYRDHP